jgi:hypothetical protein
MKIKISMAILSHLSDIQEGVMDKEMLEKELNFLKKLCEKHFPDAHILKVLDVKNFNVDRESINDVKRYILANAPKVELTTKQLDKFYS